MKKILFIISAGLVCFLMSCSNEKGSETTGESATAKKNLDACNAINKAIETGDVSQLGDYIASDGVDHSGEKGEVKGLDSIKAELQGLHSMYSNMSFDVAKELADDEYVFQWTKFSGTCTVASMGMPAGSKIESSSVHVTKFKDGKATDHWQFIEMADMMKMMGGEQKGMESMKMDSTHKM